MQIENLEDAYYRIKFISSKLDDLVPTVFLQVDASGAFHGKNMVSGSKLTELISKGVVEQRGDDVYYENHYAGTVNKLEF